MQRGNVLGNRGKTIYVKRLDRCNYRPAGKKSPILDYFFLVFFGGYTPCDCKIQSSLTYQYHIMKGKKWAK